MSTQIETIKLIHPHQALAWLNRWIELPDRWYSEDREELYAVKNCIIQQWVTDNSMAANRIIQRDSPAIAGMRGEIATGGNNLSHLNLYNNLWHQEISASPNFKYYHILNDFENGDIFVPLPTEVSKELETEYQQKITAYRNAEADYEKAHEQYLDRVALLNKELHDRTPLIKEILIGVKKKAVKKQEISQIKEVLTSLKYKTSDIRFWMKIQKIFQKNNISTPSIAIPVAPCRPKLPERPALCEHISSENYIEGTIDSVDEAIAWARTALGNPTLSLYELGDAVEKIEKYIGNEELALSKRIAIDIFREVLNGTLTKPIDIYDQLTTVSLDYEAAIGMYTYSDRRSRESVHANFSRWHEINLDLHGYWLIEFVSTIDPEICLHIPYRKAVDFMDIKNLPIEVSTQENFGRAMTEAEQKLYPVEGLLNILSLSKTNFPHELHKYFPPIDDRYFYDDDEDDYND
jgi:hypothetical protein